MTHRLFLAANPLLLGAMGVLAIATGCLIAFPSNLIVWQTASWSLVFALAALCVLVPMSAYALTTRRVARNWQRIASCAVGFVVLAVVVVGWVT